MRNRRMEKSCSVDRHPSSWPTHLAMLFFCRAACRTLLSIRIFGVGGWGSLPMLENMNFVRLGRQPTQDLLGINPPPISHTGSLGAH